ncbi:MAG: hypothetical protein EAZ62_07260 [Sphingobacteriia bacterium]|nr:MAG: hypothetical protein EAZ62_07260 [Sphingobacteriia bacterium]
MRQFKGKFYVKEVYQRIAWAQYLQGQEQKAKATLQNLLRQGATQSDADKKAQRDALAGSLPHPLLLKARLLNDGGYNTEAFALLAGKSEDDFTQEAEKLEFAYRAARIQEDLGKTEEAIRNYKIAARKGEMRPEHFGARAALQLGMIYEARGQKDLAIVYYKKCLAMENHDYKDSLDQKAKAGIARCSGE